MSTSEGMTYRLAPMDRTGFFLGLGLGQMVVLAVSVLAGVFVVAYASLPFGFMLIVLGALLGLGRLQGVSVLHLLPTALLYAKGLAQGDRTWFAALDIFGGTSSATLPPVLANQELIAVDAQDFGFPMVTGDVGIVFDAKAGTYCASVRVSGIQFPVLERGEQDSRLARWGNALGAFIQERSPVVSVRWTEHASPAGMNEHRRYLDANAAASKLHEAVDSYNGLLNTAGTLSTRHETVVSILINGRAVRMRKDHGSDRRRAAIERLCNELRLFATRMEAADLIVSHPLTPAEIARIVRLRLDPTTRPVLDQSDQLLAQQVAERGLGAVTPMATKLEWKHWRTDQGVHRAFFVHEWPRLDVTASWMDMLLMFSGAIRSVSVIYEPVPRSQSHRAITRQSSKIDGEIQERTAKGFRVGQHHRRAQEAVEERERELVAGFGEFEFAGLVTVTAATVEELERVSDEVLQVAASVGIDLRAMSGRHDQAVVATLPLALPLAGRSGGR